ncbi:MAG: fluoride efflux transporter CrcB [Pseudomonadota bacterium]|nr:fluoride efflux transporter CrcB [Pseudomonadota bacterium]
MQTWLISLAIAAGGALGALARYWMSVWVQRVAGTDFPLGTLSVNVVGSLILGFLYSWSLTRADSAPLVRSLLMVGFLGSFTTFSTFSVETLNLLTAGAFGKSLANIVLSVSIALVAASIGAWFGRTV